MSSSDPLVSVIIPAHNATAFIRETLSSVLDQSWTNVETIVIDDGSDDQTSLAVQEAGRDSIRVIRQERKGASAARNAGLRIAQGKYVQFLDADDLISQRKIELQVCALEASSPTTIAACEWVHFESDPKLAVPHPEPVWSVSDPLNWLVVSLTGGGMMQPGAWLTPRTLIDAAGPWDESLSLHDDGEFFTRVLVRADRITMVEEATAYYRSVPGSLSRHRSRSAVESAFAVCRSRHRAILEKRDDPATRKAVATQYAQFAYEFYSAAPDLVSSALSLISELRAEPAPTIGGPGFRLTSATLGFVRALKIRSALA